MCAEIAPGARARLRGHGGTSAGLCAVTKAQGKSYTVNSNTRRFCVCEFAYSLKFMCSLKINTCGTFQSLADVRGVVTVLSHPAHTMPSGMEVGGQGSAVPGAWILGPSDGT